MARLISTTVKTDNFLENNFEAKIPKSMVVLFGTMQFILGINTGFVEIYKKSHTKLVVMRRMTQFASIAIVITVFSPIYVDYNAVWFWCTLVKGIANFITLTTAKYNVCHFVVDMHKIGSDLSTINNNKLGNVLIFYTLIIIFLKFMCNLYRCLVNIKFHCTYYHVVHFSIYSYCQQCCDAIAAILIVIVYYVYCFVFNLKDNLIMKTDVTDFEKRYVALISRFEKVRWLYTRVLVVEILINTPKMMMSSWFMLAYINEKAEWYAYTSESLFACHLFMQISIPAIITQMINSQMEEIKLILNEQRRTEQDVTKSRELTRVLRYIKSRRLLHDIWRVIPLDLRLPLTLLSICTTYFIVILQFTHVYD